MIQMTFKYAVLLSRGGLDRFKAGLAAEIHPVAKGRYTNSSRYWEEVVSSGCVEVFNPVMLFLI